MGSVITAIRFKADCILFDFSSALEVTCSVSEILGITLEIITFLLKNIRIIYFLPCILTTVLMYGSLNLTHFAMMILFLLKYLFRCMQICMPLMSCIFRPSVWDHLPSA